MSSKIVIGINQRIPINILEMALQASLQGTGSLEYFCELAATEYQGTNRINKAAIVMSRLTQTNPILPFLKERKDDVIAAMRKKSDRTLIMSGIINSAYTFGYDFTAILGKYLHAQPQVSRTLILSKLSEKYGSNRSLPNALDCIVPMHIETGLFKRPQPGLYELNKVENFSNLAFDVYRHSFLLNNPMLPQDTDVTNYAYFEFVQQ